MYDLPTRWMPSLPIGSGEDLIILEVISLHRPSYIVRTRRRVRFAECRYTTVIGLPFCKTSAYFRLHAQKGQAPADVLLQIADPTPLTLTAQYTLVSMPKAQ